MPSAHSGFHEVLTRSLNELRALLAAEHDREVGELERKVLYLECKAAATSGDDSDHEQAAAPVMRAKSDRPQLMARHLSDRPKGPRDPLSVIPPLGAPPASASMKNITSNKSPEEGMVDKRSLELPKRSPEVDGRGSHHSHSSNDVGPSIRNVKSETPARHVDKDKDSPPAPGVRNFIRTAMRRRMRALGKNKAEASGGETGGGRTSTHSHVGGRNSQHRRGSHHSQVGGRSSQQSLHESPINNRMSVLSRGSLDVEDLPQEPKKLVGSSSFTPGWPSDAASAGSRRTSHEKQYRPANFKARKSVEEDLLDDDSETPQSALALASGVVKATEHDFPPRLTLSQRLTLMGLNPEIANLNPEMASTQRGSNNPELAVQAMRASAHFQALAGLSSQMAGLSSPMASLLAAQSFAPMMSDEQRLSQISQISQLGIQPHHPLHHVLFSDGVMAGDETCPVCESCGNAFMVDAKFCRKCGTKRPQDQVCDSCGSVYAHDALFCRHCGKKRMSLMVKQDFDGEEPQPEVSEDRTVAAQESASAGIASNKHSVFDEGRQNISASSSKKHSLFSDLEDDDETQSLSAMTPMVMPQASLPFLATASSSSSPAHPSPKDIAAAARPGVSPPRRSLPSRHSEKKDTDKAEDTKDGSSPEHLPGKLQKRRDKAIRRMETKELGPEEDEFKPSLTRDRTKSLKGMMEDRVAPWDGARDADPLPGTVAEGDGIEHKERPESAKSRRSRARRSRCKARGTSRSRSPNPGAMADPAAPQNSDAEASDSDSCGGAGTKSLTSNAYRGDGCKSMVSSSSASSSSEDGAAAVKPLTEGELEKRLSRKSLRFSEKREALRCSEKQALKKRATKDKETELPLPPPGSSASPPPELADENPAPPVEAAPQLPILNVPTRQSTNTESDTVGPMEAISLVDHVLSMDGPLNNGNKRFSIQGPRGPIGGRNSLMESPSFTLNRNGGIARDNSIIRNSLLGQLQSSASFLQNSRRGSLLNPDEWGQDDHSEDESDMFELLGVWSMQIWRKSMRVKRDQAGDADEDDLDYGNYIVVNEAVHEEKRFSCKSLMKKMIIQPSSLVHLSWEMLGLLLIMWDVIIIPLDVYEPNKSVVIDYMTWFLRVFWLLDIIISFMTGYLQDQGTLEMRPMRIALRYLKTWFWPDMICVSMDWATVVLQSLNNYRGLRIVRTVRLFRLLKAPEIDAFISEHIHSDNVILTGNIIKSIILLMGVAHVLACVWYIVGKESADPGAEGWVRSTDLLDTGVQIRYMWSLQWALAQFTGENVYEPRNMNMSERTYAVVVLLLTFLFSSMFVSSITTSVTQLQLTKSSSATQLTSLRRYLVDADISTSLAVRVLRNAQHLVNEQKRNVPEQRIELLAVVSEPLRAELHFEVHGRILREHSFFDLYTDINPQGIRKVCHMAIVSSHVSRGDIIFSDLETPAWPRMFFTVSGKLQYKQVEEKPEFLLKDQWAAEAVLWTLWMHVGTLRALGESDLLAVEAEKFQHIISPFPTNHAYLYANTFVECLNTVEEETLTDLDAKLVEPYLKQIFPERFHEAIGSEEPRHSGGVFAAASAVLSPTGTAANSLRKSKTLLSEEHVAPKEA